MLTKCYVISSEIVNPLNLIQPSLRSSKATISLPRNLSITIIYEDAANYQSTPITVENLNLTIMTLTALVVWHIWQNWRLERVQKGNIRNSIINRNLKHGGILEGRKD